MSNENKNKSGFLSAIGDVAEDIIGLIGSAIVYIVEAIGGDD